jgi:ORF6N domain
MYRLMFPFTGEELRDWRRHFGTSNGDLMGLRYPPFAFTEQGVAMLSGVLNSDRAILVNIQIMRIFTKMREMLITHKDLLMKVEQIERKVTNQDDRIKLLFDYLKKFVDGSEKNRRLIGYSKK